MLAPEGFSETDRPAPISAATRANRLLPREGFYERIRAVRPGGRIEYTFVMVTEGGAVMLFVGIDWSDLSLEFHARTAEGRVVAEGRVRPNAEGLGELFAKLEAHAPPSEIAVAIETTHGAWVQALLDRGYRVYPINPKCAENFRKSLSAAGDKSDRIDRKALALMLAALHQQLRPMQPDDPEMVALRIACQDRVRLVEERTGKINELLSLVKQYYPAFPGLFGEIDSDIALAFLEDFPTQKAMRALTFKRLQNWVKRHGYTRTSRLPEMEQHLKAAVLPVADHLQNAKAPLIQYLARSLRALQAEIARREQEISDRFNGMPEADWVRSLPGAGDALAPALLACLGRDPARFADVAAARAFLGTAPVTKASGKTQAVVFRRGCWKFGRRTLQLFAEQSRRYCTWAAKFYEKQRASNHGHHAALRALAHKWVKIILAMRRTGTPYDDDKYTHSCSQRLLNPRVAHA